MTRGRVKLAYIENKSRRKACYRKRKESLIKKVEELSTLCGIEACVIIYNPFDEGPQIWPPTHSAVQGVLEKFKNLTVTEQNRKILNQESFTRLRICKLQQQFKKLCDEIREKEIKLFVSQFLEGKTQRDFTLDDLNEMRWLIHSFMQKIYRRLETVKGQSLLPPALTAGGGNGYEPEVAPEMTVNMMVQNEQSTGFGNGCNPVVAPELPLDYSQNPTWSMNEMVQNEQSVYSSNGYNPVVPPEIPRSAMNITVQNEQFAGFDNGHDPAVALEMPIMNYSQDPTQGTTPMVQNEQIAGFDNCYNPVVAPELPMDYSQNPAWDMDTMVPNEQSANFGNGYDVAFTPETAMNDPPNSTSDMNMMVAQEQSANFSNVYDDAFFTPEMATNDPPNPISDLNSMVPPEQSAGSGNFDWISYLFGDDIDGAAMT